MKIINNTEKNITLVNNKIIKRYDFIIVNNPSAELIKQLENLANLGLVRAEF